MLSWPRVLGPLLLVLAGSVQAQPITDSLSAVAAAKRQLRARCVPETPCTFTPQRDGRQWRVWVRFSRRDATGTGTSARGGQIVLYFDAGGNLLRRLDVD